MIGVQFGHIVSGGRSFSDCDRVPVAKTLPTGSLNGIEHARSRTGKEHNGCECWWVGWWINIILAALVIFTMNSAWTISVLVIEG